MKQRFSVACAALISMIVPATAADVIKIGLVTTLTTPSAIIGRDVVDAMNLAIQEVGGTIAGRKIELIVEDDATKPELGRQKVEKLLQQDKVDILTGINWSNVLLAARKPILDSGKIFVSVNAGPSEIAGKLCAENMFFMRGPNDMAPMGLGQILNKMGVTKMYAMAPNYAAGKDMVAGLERTFKGQIVGRDFTKWGDDPQLDFSAELSKVRASGAEGLFTFYPGRTSAAFARQYDQSGLATKVKLYSVFTLDQLALPTLQDAGLKDVLGSIVSDYYGPDIDNPENKRFVETFDEKYHRIPSNYAALAYDTIPRLKAAIEQAGGTADTAKLRAALKAVRYKSVLGPYIVSKNNFAVQPIYKFVIAPDSKGRWKMAGNELAFRDVQDPYVSECKLAE
jgi:branched-chain amino acid transport system substrate-binding protein